MGHLHHYRYKKALMFKIRGLFCDPDREYELVSKTDLGPYILSFHAQSGSLNINPYWDKEEVGIITQFLKQKLGLKKGVSLRFSKDNRHFTLKIKSFKQTIISKRGRGHYLLYGDSLQPNV